MSEYGDDTIRINFYGRNGSGKTTLACTFPKPLLLVGFEDGTKSVRRVEGVKFIHVKSTEMALQLAGELRSDGHYHTVVIDTATSLQDLILTEILGLSQVPVILNWGTVSQTQYRQRSEKTREVLRKFIDLQGKNVVVLAQEKNHSAKDGEGGGDSELLTPFVASSLGVTTCGWLNENVDYICQTFVREEVVTTEKTVGAGKASRSISSSRRTGRVEFCLRTQRGHPVYAAKIRADKNVDVPDLITDPSYDKLMSALRGDN